jgi:hypothetical protein
MTMGHVKKVDNLDKKSEEFKKKKAIRCRDKKMNLTFVSINYF